MTKRLDASSDENSTTLTGPTAFLYSILLFLLRGAALWIVVPCVVVGWVLAMPLKLLPSMRPAGGFPRFSQYLSWADACLVAVLTNGVLRSFGERHEWPDWPRHRSQVREPFRWVDLQ